MRFPPHSHAHWFPSSKPASNQVVYGFTGHITVATSFTTSRCHRHPTRHYPHLPRVRRRSSRGRNPPRLMRVHTDPPLPTDLTCSLEPMRTFLFAKLPRGFPAGTTVRLVILPSDRIATAGHIAFLTVQHESASFFVLERNAFTQKPCRYPTQTVPPFRIVCSCFPRRSSASRVSSCFSM